MQSNYKLAIGAATGASVLMLLFGLVYRAVAAKIEAPVDANPVSQAMLDRLPMEIGGWTGQEAPIEDNIIEATDTDAHVSRQYRMQSGSGLVSLWIAAGVRARDLMPHRPEVCYTGSGYTLMRHEVLDLPLADGTILSCNAMQFTRGTLTGSRVLVLYYYLVDGQYCRDVAEWRYKVIWTPISYIAQVQVVAAITESTGPDVAMRYARQFTIESAPQIAELFRCVETAPRAE